MVAVMLVGCRGTPPPVSPATRLSPPTGTGQDWMTAREALAAFRVLERRGGAPESIRFTVAKRRSDLGGVVLQLSDPTRPARKVLVDVGPDRQTALGSVDVFRGDQGAFRLATCLEDLAQRSKEPLALLELRPMSSGIEVFALGFPGMPGTSRTYTFDSLGKLVSESSSE